MKVYKKYILAILSNEIACIRMFFDENNIQVKNYENQVDIVNNGKNFTAVIYNTVVKFEYIDEYYYTKNNKNEDISLEKLLATIGGNHLILQIANKYLDVNEIITIDDLYIFDEYFFKIRQIKIYDIDSNEYQLRYKTKYTDYTLNELIKNEIPFSYMIVRESIQYSGKSKLYISFDEDKIHITNKSYISEYNINKLKIDKIISVI